MLLEDKNGTGGWLFLRGSRRGGGLGRIARHLKQNLGTPFLMLFKYGALDSSATVHDRGSRLGTSRKLYTSGNIRMGMPVRPTALFGVHKFLGASAS